MSDMTATIIPKSDQINADDLIAGPRTIRITAVAVRPGTEQPVSVSIDGDQKVFRPCKSMCRVMVQAWGADSSAYVGKSMTLFRDPKVKWGGVEIGGIRIAAMSHIDAPLRMALSESKAVRKPIEVKVLQVAVDAPTPDDTRPDAESYVTRYIAALNKVPVRDALVGFTAKHKPTLDAIRADHPDLGDKLDAAMSARLAVWDAADTDAPEF